MMHADFGQVTSLLGQPGTIRVTGTGAPAPAAWRGEMPQIHWQTSARNPPMPCHPT